MKIKKKKRNENRKSDVHNAVPTVSDAASGAEPWQQEPALVPGGRHYRAGNLTLGQEDTPTCRKPLVSKGVERPNLGGRESPLSTNYNEVREMKEL